MKNVTKQQAEQAIKDWTDAKIRADEIKGELEKSTAIITAYGINHIAEFADGRLVMDNGVLAIRSGVAKAVKEGKPLSTAAKAELAAALPVAYVKTACDFAVLFGAQDKTVRQILQSRGIEVVREDIYFVK